MDIESLSSIKISQLTDAQNILSSDHLIISRRGEDGQYVSMKATISAYTKQIVERDFATQENLSYLCVYVENSISGIKDGVVTLIGDQTIESRKTFSDQTVFKRGLECEINEDGNIIGITKDGIQKAYVTFEDQNGTFLLKSCVLDDRTHGDYPYVLISSGPDGSTGVDIHAQNVTINSHKVITESNISSYIPVIPQGMEYVVETWKFKPNEGQDISKHVIVAKNRQLV